MSAHDDQRSRRSGVSKGTAAEAMDDPMSQLLASRGMPLGMSFRKQDKDVEAEDPSAAPRPEPGYNMEALSEVLDFVKGSGQQQQQQQQHQQQGQSEGAASAPFASGGTAGPTAVDSWGTTRQSAAEIAKQLAEANAAVRAAGDAFPSVASEGSESDDDAPMALSPSEAKYSALEDISKDIKKLDEVWEVLASVPWLSEDVLDEKELKGVAMVGLLGTLEEVGFNVTDQVHRIWAGERHQDIMLEGKEYRDQAALLAIMYHTKQIEDKHGVPPSGYLPMPKAASQQAGKPGGAVAQAVLSSLAGLPSQKH